MFSINLRRSAATLGVVAGLLAAAGPASAQVMPGMIGVTAPHPGSKPSVWHEAARTGIVTASGVTTSDGWPDGTSQNGDLTVFRAPTTAWPSKVEISALAGSRAIGTIEELLELKAPTDALTHEGGFVKAPTNAMNGNEGDDTLV